MADSSKTAYIGIERDENSLKYIAKVFNESPSQITKSQYNAIVKSLREYDWSSGTEDEADVINKIITVNLQSVNQTDNDLLNE